MQCNLMIDVSTTHAQHIQVLKEFYCPHLSKARMRMFVNVPAYSKLPELGNFVRIFYTVIDV